MSRLELLLCGCLAVAIGVAPTAAASQDQSSDLKKLAVDLDLTQAGLREWLTRLGATEAPPAERLLAVNTTGELLMALQGAGASVVVDSVLDERLRQPDSAVVLIHNHPSSKGLSAADLQQLAKPGVAAIVAVGHDGSVFVAAAGRRFDPDLFEVRQFERARSEVEKRLRAGWSVGRVPVAVSDAHFSHLVTLALAQSGIVRYWFRLSGDAHGSYDAARIAFGHVVAGASATLRKAAMK